MPKRVKLRPLTEEKLTAQKYLITMEKKNKYVIIGGGLGLIAGISFGGWLASGWDGSVGQKIGPVLFFGIFGLGVGGGLSWWIGMTVQNPVVGRRLLAFGGLVVLLITLRLLLGLPPVAVVPIMGIASALLYWQLQ